MPTEFYGVPGPWVGRLAIAARPRGGDWLEDELRGWKEAGVCRVLSLLEPDEVRELELTQESALGDKLGLCVHSFPIPDRGVPSAQVFYPVLMATHAALQAGEMTLIHCRQGIGRSSLIAATVLFAVTNTTPDEVWRVVERPAATTFPIPPNSVNGSPVGASGLCSVTWRSRRDRCVGLHPGLGYEPDSGGSIGALRRVLQDDFCEFLRSRVDGFILGDRFGRGWMILEKVLEVLEGDLVRGMMLMTVAHPSPIAEVAACVSCRWHCR